MVKTKKKKLIKKTLKKNKSNTKKKMLKAICVLHPNKYNVNGIIYFYQINKSKVKVVYDITGLKDGKHGFHVHESGDLTHDCQSACGHFNPYNKNHGGPNSKERHVGDLGNIISIKGIAKNVFYDNYITLNMKKKNSIIGRAIVIHADEDDLGKKNNLESKTTGNAGKRLACGIIGIVN